MAIPGYSVRKAAQVAAFLTKARGGEINFLTLVKLIYLSDRAFLKEYDIPITNDELVSMTHGPVNSEIYDYLKRRIKDSTWDYYINSFPKERVVKLARQIDDDDFDELSDAEIRILTNVAKEFEKYKGDPWDLVNWIHNNCKEWENVGKTSKHLPFERVLSALGKKNEKAITDTIFEFKNLQSAHNAAK